LRLKVFEAAALIQNLNFSLLAYSFVSPLLLSSLLSSSLSTLLLRVGAQQK